MMPFIQRFPSQVVVHDNLINPHTSVRDDCEEVSIEYDVFDAEATLPSPVNSDSSEQACQQHTSGEDFDNTGPAALPPALSQARQQQSPVRVFNNGVLSMPVFPERFEHPATA